MTWCPKCKVEYKEGITVCADCGSKLVDELKQEIPILTGEKELITRLADFLTYNQIPSSCEDNEETELTELYVTDKFETKARRAAAVFLQQEELNKAAQSEGDTDEEDKSDDTEEETDAADFTDELDEEEVEKEIVEIMNERPVIYQSSVYQKSEDKAKDFKSSAYVLIFVGILGIALLVMIHLGYIPIQFANQFLMDIVMGAMFIAFIIIGIFSFRSSRQYEKKSIEENSLSESIQKWCDENLNREVIDVVLTDSEEDLPEEMKYFKRTSKMKSLVADKFMNLDENFLDEIIEGYYEKIFEKNEESE